MEVVLEGAEYASWTTANPEDKVKDGEFARKDGDDQCHHSRQDVRASIAKDVWQMLVVNRQEVEVSSNYVILLALHIGALVNRESGSPCEAGVQQPLLEGYPTMRRRQIEESKRRACCQCHQHLPSNTSDSVKVCITDHESKCQGF